MSLCYVRVKKIMLSEQFSGNQKGDATFYVSIQEVFPDTSFPVLMICSNGIQVEDKVNVKLEYCFVSYGYDATLPC
jgi:hypothetical protein